MKSVRRDIATLVRLLSCVVLSCSCFVSLECVRGQDDLSVEQSSAALQIATSTASAMGRLSEMADETGSLSSAAKEELQKLQKISTEAVARALQFGPPTRSETEASDPLIFRSVVVDIHQKIPRSTVESFREGLPSTLQSLSAKWRQYEVQPELAYQALQVCVNPPNRPDRLFLYAKESRNPIFPSFSEAKSAAHEFVWWAAKANRIDDLERALNEQQLDSVAEGCFLFLLLAIERQDEASIRERCQQLQTFVQRASDPDLLRLLATCLMKAQLSVRTLPEATALLQQTGETLLAVNRQSRGQANFAATAAADGFRATVSDFLRQEPENRSSEAVVECANRLVRNHRLSGPLSEKFHAAIADEFLLAGLDDIELAEPLKSFVAERRLRFANRVQLQPSADVVVNWNPKGLLDEDSIAVHLSSLEDVGSEDLPVAFTLSGLVSVGSPCANFDGSVIAFHGRKAGRPIGAGNHVYVVNRDRKTITDIGAAVNPSLTATGRRLTCSRYTPGIGVWIVRSDGSNWELLDEAGWASKFSPSGTKVAYTVTSKGQTGMLIYDVVSHCLRPENGQSFPRPVGRAEGFAMTGWPFCWAKTDLSQEGEYFWWLNQKDHELLMYPVHRLLMDKYLWKERLKDIVNVVQDLNCLQDGRLVWLGRIQGQQPELAFWQQGQIQPTRLPGRRLRGMTVFGQDQVLTMSSLRGVGK
ncbi:MAG: hypothetical protein ABJZ55_11190 [Fuerstiella sp.]